MRGIKVLWLCLLLTATWALIGCEGDDDDDDTVDDTYSGPVEANINLNVFGTVGGEPYELLVVFTGDDVTSCGAQSGGDVVPFKLESSPSLVDTDGQLSITADGWLTDTAVNPSQSLSAADDGGVYEMTIPEAASDPFTWVEGTCFIYVHSQPESCFDNPDIPFCGNFSCGSDEELMANGAGDGIWVTGTFNCYD